MGFDFTDDRHPTLFKGVQFYIWPTRWAKPSEELALFIRRKGGKCYDWHALDLTHNELVTRAKTPGLVLVDPTEKGSPELLNKGEEGDLRFISWAYPHLCFQIGECINLQKAAKRLLFVRMCDGTPYAFHFDCDRTNARELHRMGELEIQFMNHGGKVVEDHKDADAIVTAKEGDALKALQAEYSFATQTRVETFAWLKDSLSRPSWRFSPPSRKPLGGRPPKQRLPYTPEEDALLVKYIADHTGKTGEGRQGQILFKNLVALGEKDASYSWVKRHSWQSWRNHYVKVLKEAFDNKIGQYQADHPPTQTDGYGTYPYTRKMNKRNMAARTTVRLRRQGKRREKEEEEAESETDEELDELESDEDTEGMEQGDKKGDTGGSEYEPEHEAKGKSRQGQRQRDASIPPESRQEDEGDLFFPPDDEDNGDSAYSKQDEFVSAGEERPVSPPPPPVKAKRQRQTDDVEASEDDERERQRKRRKTNFTQSTLVNPTQYNPFRGSPLSKAVASERAPSHGILSPTRLPVSDLSKHAKRIPTRPLPVMDFTVGRAKRRESIAQRIADQTFVLEHEEDEDEEAEVAISPKEGLRHSRRHQEEDFGEVAELPAPKRQRKTRLNPESIPAMTYRTVRTGVKTRSQSRAETPLSEVHVDTRSKTGRSGSRRRGNARY